MCQSINPPRNSFPCQPSCNVICEMIAVLGYEMIRIAMILRSHTLNKTSEFRNRHVDTTQRDWASKNKTRAGLGLHFENSTNREVMCTEAIFHTMNCNCFPLCKTIYRKEIPANILWIIHQFTKGNFLMNICSINLIYLQNSSILKCY